MNDKVHLLLIDDEKNYLLVLETLLTEAGYAVTALNDPETALAFLEESEVDIVITDMKMPRISGREVLERVKKNWPHIPVLIMTAFGSIESAVEAMKYGAFDYITKPFSNDELLLSIHNATELARAHRQYRLLQEAMEERYRAIRDVLVMVDRAAPSRSTVLITGESGTGKELVARAIHYASPRKEKPFVSVNCMALNPGVLESELFGHEKGSFTGAGQRRIGRFEQADGGTIFLDEIGEIDAGTQVRLLRVLSERTIERVGSNASIPVNVRVIAATNKSLKKLVQEGKFREDLYFRLNVVHIQMPPLRDRREDIPLLATAFLKEFARENNKEFKPLSRDALEAVRNYQWPGNVRELRTAMEHGVVMSNSASIGLHHLPPQLQDTSPEAAPQERPEDNAPNTQNGLVPAGVLNLSLLERNAIQQALAQSNGNKTAAAHLLGISRRTLQRKLQDILHS